MCHPNPVWLQMAALYQNKQSHTHALSHTQHQNLRSPTYSCTNLQTVRFLYDTLTKDGYRVVMLHGDRSQPERDEALRGFRGGKAQVCKCVHVCFVCVYVVCVCVCPWSCSA